MNKVKCMAIALGLVIISSFGANAQKIGYVDAEAILYSMPEIPGIQQKIEQWQRDSVGPKYTSLLNQYNDKDSVYKKTTNASLKKTLEGELNELGSALANWQQIAGQATQQKQAQLLAPLNKKIMDAINAVAKEKSMTYVLNPGALIVAPPGDDITLTVAQRLGIKAPAGNPPASTSPAKK